jgi:hypothetical protein
VILSVRAMVSPSSWRGGPFFSELVENPSSQASKLTIVRKHDSAFRSHRLVLAAEEPSTSDVTVALTVSQRGTYVYATGATGRPVPELEKSIQALAGCRWIPNQGGNGGGRCKGLPKLEPHATEFNLRLSPIVEGLTRERNHNVRLNVTLPDSLPETVPLPQGWRVMDDSAANNDIDDDDDSGGDYSRRTLEFVSQDRQLPPDLKLPIALLGRIQEPTAYLSLSLDSMHRLSISARSTGQDDFPADLWAKFSKSIPCKGSGSPFGNSNEYLVFACRTPLMAAHTADTTVAIGLATAVKALHGAGFSKVIVTFDVDSKAPAIAGWEKQERNARIGAHFTFTSSRVEQLPEEHAFH